MLQYDSAAMFESFKRGPQLGTIMPRNASFLDTGCYCSQSGTYLNILCGHQRFSSNDANLNRNNTPCTGLRGDGDRGQLNVCMFVLNYSRVDGGKFRIQ